jgi:NAD(P)H-nitrite reductase
MNVTVLHLMDRIMDRQLDSKASQMLKTAIEQKGITILTEANTECLIGEEGHVTQVKLKDGTVLAADLVVFAVVFVQISHWHKVPVCVVTVVCW